MSKKLCSISVDLDPLTAYYKIHGLGDPPRLLRYTILRKALPRFEELFAEAEVPATIFVVGQELEGSDEAPRSSSAWSPPATSWPTTPTRTPTT